MNNIKLARPLTANERSLNNEALSDLILNHRDLKDHKGNVFGFGQRVENSAVISVKCTYCHQLVGLTPKLES